MLAAAVLSLLFGAAIQPSAEFPKAASPEVAAERVKACGFDHVRPKYDRELEEDVIEVSGVSQVPEAEMRCVVRVSLDTVRYVEFPKPASKEYWRLYFQMDQSHGGGVGWKIGSATDAARAWLKQRGLLDEVPHYRKGRDDNLRFARRLEHVCGPKARGAFVLLRGHLILRPGPSGQLPIDYPAFQCLMNAIIVSGMPFGFVGNETYQKQ
jgi:hypothetical protein